MRKIVDANSKYEGQPKRWIERLLRKRYGEFAPRVEWDNLQGHVVARVNHGRWIADCPSPVCHGAMYVTPGLPYFCVDCLNAANGGKVMTVVFPVERGAIEQVLLKRPHSANQNWLPHESLQHLMMENKQHGVD